MTNKSDKKEYSFYGWEKAVMAPVREEYKKIADPRMMYDLMSEIWCEYSCAPRLRPKWSKENMTLGQCSVTSFLVQDVFGGKVYGVPLPEGGYHCYNVVDGVTFDLTDAQFGGEKLNYDPLYEQTREQHFADREKYARYLFLKEELQKKL